MRSAIKSFKRRNARGVTIAAETRLKPRRRTEKKTKDPNGNEAKAKELARRIEIKDCN